MTQSCQYWSCHPAVLGPCTCRGRMNTLTTNQQGIRGSESTLTHLKTLNVLAEIHRQAGLEMITIHPPNESIVCHRRVRMYYSYISHAMLAGGHPEHLGTVFFFYPKPTRSGLSNWQERLLNVWLCRCFLDSVHMLGCLSKLVWVCCNCLLLGRHRSLRWFFSSPSQTSKCHSWSLKGPAEHFCLT